MIYRQNTLLRAQALGNYRQLLHAIARDPAMPRYLNNQQNRKCAPNENFALELLELFALGEGHYSEQDIKEAARAFTGCKALPPPTVASSRSRVSTTTAASTATTSSTSTLPRVGRSAGRRAARCASCTVANRGSA